MLKSMYRRLFVFFVFIQIALLSGCVGLDPNIHNFNLTKISQIDEDGIKILHEKISLNGKDISIYTAEFSPLKYSFELVRAQGKIDGSDRVSHIAKEKNAILAINGGFFSIYEMKGIKLPSYNLNTCYPNDLSPYNALPSRILKVDNNWYGSFFELNSAVGWNKDGNSFVVGKISSRLVVKYNDKLIKINSLNKYLEGEDSAVFTSVWGNSIPIYEQGIMVTVQDNKVKKVVQFFNTRSHFLSIPKDGFVLYLKDSQNISQFEVGKPMKLNFQIDSENDENTREWNKADYILSGVPFLIKNGKINYNYPNSAFYLDAHARTAVCKLRNKNLLLFVATGSDEVTGKKIGLGIPKLSELMLDKGCLEAINLDGGHSSVFYYKGNILNRSFPKNEDDCSQLHERSVSDAIIVR
jgi:exopolysaccharide biosynthesis protein